MRLLVVTAVALGACGSQSPAPQPIANEASSPPPLTAPAITELEFGGERYTIEGTAEVQVVDDSETRIVTVDFTLELSVWPESNVFVQTAAELEKAARRDAPKLRVVHVREMTRGEFELVYEHGGKLDGTVLHRGRGDGVLCGFKVENSWEAALEACRSLRLIGDAEGGAVRTPD